MLKIEHLSIAYDEKLVLEDVSLEFMRGTVTVICGVSGAGKSSLLHTLGLMQQGNKYAKYYYDDVDITQYTEREKADFRLYKIGFVFQQNNLLTDFSALENVCMPLFMGKKAESNGARASELLEYVGLRHLKDKYPNELSGGEQQRVAIARALINEADIILADEPTASLDDENAKIVLDLLQKLAVERGKIVIIASHDAKVLKIADGIYEITNKSVNVVQPLTRKERKIRNEQKETQDVVTKRSLFSFSKFYTTKRLGDRTMNKIFVIITAVISSMVMLFFNFGNAYTTQQKNFINTISDKSIFVVNDTLGLNTKVIYTEMLAIDKKTLAEVRNIPNIGTCYPYYEFSSVGFSSNKNDQAQVTLKDQNNIVFNKTYENTFLPEVSSDKFVVAPLYREENMSYLLDQVSEVHRQEDGMIVTHKFAQSLGMSAEQLLDKDIEVQVFVPVKLYRGKADKPNKTNVQGMNTAEQVDIDGTIRKLVTIKRKIVGVLSSAYQMQRSDTTETLFLPYDIFEQILTENQAEHYGETYPGFPEKKLAPNALVIFANTYEKIPHIIADLENISPAFSISHTAADVQVIQTNLLQTRTIMTLITTVCSCIIILLFGILYYIKNRSRKSEIGILKAIGMTERNVMYVIAFEMGKIAMKSFVLGLMIASLFMLAFNGVYNIELFSITAGSLVLGGIVSFGVIMIGGMLPIYHASMADPVDAISERME